MQKPQAPTIKSFIVLLCRFSSDNTAKSWSSFYWLFHQVSESINLARTGWDDLLLSSILFYFSEAISFSVAGFDRQERKLDSGMGEEMWLKFEVEERLIGVSVSVLCWAGVWGMAAVRAECSSVYIQVNTCPSVCIISFSCIASLLLFACKYKADTGTVFKKKQQQHNYGGIINGGWVAWSTTQTLNKNVCTYCRGVSGGECGRMFFITCTSCPTVKCSEELADTSAF